MNESLSISLKVYSLFVNCNRFIKTGKDTVNDWESLYVYNKCKRFIIQKCDEVTKYINNGFFDIDDVRTYILHKLIYSPKLQWSDIKPTEIPSIIKLYNMDNLKKDKEFILLLSKKTNLKDIKDFFKVNSDGGNIMYDLFLGNKISPLIYIKLCYNKGKDVKYSESNELKRMNIISEKLHEIIFPINTILTNNIESKTEQLTE